MPLSKELEWVWVSDIVDKNDLVRFAKQIECDLFEDVLSGYVDHVKLYAGIWPAFDWNVFDSILAALRHHVIVVEVLFCELVNDLGFPNGWLSRDYNTRP